MNKRDKLVEKYANDLKEKCGVIPIVELLDKITTSCGPSIYNQDASIVSSQSELEIERVKNNFLIKKLGLSNSSRLDKGLQKVFEQYGTSNRHKYRVVLYYLLTVHFKKEYVFYNN